MAERKVFLAKPESVRYTIEKAVKLKCLDCSGGRSEAVKGCTLVKCPLWAFRFGVEPQKALERMTKNDRAEFIDVRRIEHIEAAQMDKAKR